MASGHDGASTDGSKGAMEGLSCFCTALLSLLLCYRSSRSKHGPWSPGATQARREEKLNTTGLVTPGHHGVLSKDGSKAATRGLTAEHASDALAQQCCYHYSTPGPVTTEPSSKAASQGTTEALAAERFRCFCTAMLLPPQHSWPQVTTEPSSKAGSKGTTRALTAEHASDAFARQCCCHHGTPGSRSPRSPQ